MSARSARARKHDRKHNLDPPLPRDSPNISVDGFGRSSTPSSSANSGTASRVLPPNNGSEVPSNGSETPSKGPEITGKGSETPKDSKSSNHKGSEESDAKGLVKSNPKDVEGKGLEHTDIVKSLQKQHHDRTLRYLIEKCKRGRKNGSFQFSSSAGLPIRKKGKKHNKALGPSFPGNPKHHAPSSNSSKSSFDPMSGDGFAVKKFLGNAKGTKSWMALRRDPELWDDNADTVVYLEYNNAKSEPSFRIRSAVIQSIGSEDLQNVLRLGYMYESVQSGVPPSPSASPETVTTSSEAQSVTRTDDHSHLTRGEPTPPISSPTSEDRLSVGSVHHKLILTPDKDSFSDRCECLREHLVRRNVLAVLYGKSLVGLDLFSALSDLKLKMEEYVTSNYDVKSEMIEYILKQGLDDVRDDPESAVGLLAWSEQVEWLEGWREAFVHCVGMYDRIKDLATFTDVSAVTRRLLESKNNQMYLRIQDTQKRLEKFNFNDMWPMSSANDPVAKLSFERLQSDLQEFYANQFSAWAPQSKGGGCWLNRTITMQLQEDFAAVYDMYVDRDVVFYTDEDNFNREWKMVSKGEKPHFSADIPSLPIQEILLSFDNRSASSAHIPHPFPLLPNPVKPAPPHKKKLFHKKDKGLPDATLITRRTAEAYNEASNLFTMGTEFKDNRLVNYFQKHEQEDKLGEVNPFDARLGRWVLIYGILQVLSHVSVDTPGVTHKKGVTYFLNPPLRGCPPWQKDAVNGFREADYMLSHCWKVAKKWESEKRVLKSSLRNHHPILVNNYGDGSPNRPRGNVPPRFDLAEPLPPIDRHYNSPGRSSPSRSSPPAPVDISRQPPSRPPPAPPVVVAAQRAPTHHTVRPSPSSSFYRPSGMAASSMPSAASPLRQEGVVSDEKEAIPLFGSSPNAFAQQKKKKK